jgi:DNA-binding transcriptional ArsR family regulator
VLADADIAAPATLIGDGTRATFLTALAGGEALPATQLAKRAGVTASTASIQLSKLVDGGLVTAERNGRHRYYRLRDASIAAALESLALIAPPTASRSLKQARIGADLQAARTCYDHLAGALGVELFDALLRQRLLTEELERTRRGAAFFGNLGVDLDRAQRARRAFARRCLDWSERRHHLAGGLGAALTARFFELGWIERTGSSRAVRLTRAGRDALARELSLELQ